MAVWPYCPTRGQPGWSSASPGGAPPSTSPARTLHQVATVVVGEEEREADSKSGFCQIIYGSPKTFFGVFCSTFFTNCVKTNYLTLKLEIFFVALCFMLDPDLYILKGRYPVPVQVLKNKNKNFLRCYFLSLSCVKNFRSEEKKNVFILSKV